jgi:tRNA-modifying protein YgfZ
MSDNPQNSASRTQTIESGWFALSDHALVALEGRDAVAFAQAQLMNDVLALPEGNWQWNGWLTPKGRVIALFALLRPAPDTVWLVVPDADPHELVERLRRFVFRSKLTITVRDDLRPAGCFAPPERDEGSANTADPARATPLPNSGWSLDMGGANGARSLRISTEPAAQDLHALARWRAFDLSHGWPRLDASQREQWTPQQLSLERLRAFSVKKGCYPGQEIVARTHFLGQAKRGLGLVETDLPTRPGDALREHEQADAPVAGTVICAEGRLAMAVLPLRQEAADTPDVDSAAPETKGPAQGGASWRRMELSGGLER